MPANLQTVADLPLFLITVHGKGDTENLSRAEIAAMRKLTMTLKQSHGRRE